MTGDITPGVPGHLVATTTAWGAARPLDEVLDRIAAYSAATTVELAIGAKPVADPDAALDAHRDRFTYLGHHTLPLGKGVNLRPDTTSRDAVAAACRRFDLARYSAHPPHAKHATPAQFYEWAAAYHDTLADIGVAFAVETMYVPRTPTEVAASGGYHLATPTEVLRFCEWAHQRGWTQPLVVDVSHLHIGWHAGDWTEGDIAEVLASGCYTEVHLSQNDGRSDAHQPLRPTHRISRWVADGLASASGDLLVVDEGRRRVIGGVWS